MREPMSFLVPFACTMMEDTFMKTLDMRFLAGGSDSGKLAYSNELGAEVTCVPTSCACEQEPGRSETEAELGSSGAC